MAHHELKIVEPHYTLAREGKKPFEIRKNDRDFSIGDFVILEPFCAAEGKRIQHFPNLYRMITCISSFQQKEDFVVLGLKVPTQEERENYFTCAACGEPMGVIGSYRFACSSSCAREFYD